MKYRNPHGKHGWQKQENNPKNHQQVDQTSRPTEGDHEDQTDQITDHWR